MRKPTPRISGYKKFTTRQLIDKSLLTIYIQSDTGEKLLAYINEERHTATNIDELVSAANAAIENAGKAEWREYIVVVMSDDVDPYGDQQGGTIRLQFTRIRAAKIGDSWRRCHWDDTASVSNSRTIGSSESRAIEAAPCVVKNDYSSTKTGYIPYSERAWKRLQQIDKERRAFVAKQEAIIWDGKKTSL